MATVGKVKDGLALQAEVGWQRWRLTDASFG